MMAPAEQTHDKTKARQLLEEGKERMKLRCSNVARMNTPLCVSSIQIRKSLTGYACTSGTMAVPRPFTRKALYVFLHECAHFELGHVVPGETVKQNKHRHREEYEAEMWAQEKMREAGIQVPKAMVQRAKRHVAHKIRQALLRGAQHIDVDAARFAAS